MRPDALKSIPSFHRLLNVNTSFSWTMIHLMSCKVHWAMWCRTVNSGKPVHFGFVWIGRKKWREICANEPRPIFCSYCWRCFLFFNIFSFISNSLSTLPFGATICSVYWSSKLPHCSFYGLCLRFMSSVVWQYNVCCVCPLEREGMQEKQCWNIEITFPSGIVYSSSCYTPRINRSILNHHWGNLSAWGPHLIFIRGKWGKSFVELINQLMNA